MRIEAVRFYVRETRPARFPSALGKQGQSTAAATRVTSPLCHCRMVVRDDSGRRSWGCSADRLSVRWLDKRPGRDTALKRRELADLIHWAGRLYEAHPQVETPWASWWDLHPRVMAEGQRRGQERLTSSFASALLERALVDAFCRLHGQSVWEMLDDERLGLDPARVAPELRGTRYREWFPDPPRTEIAIRHTVGLFDPLTAADWPADQRLNDGLPETLEECLDQHGLRYFKLKISGDPERDLHRLQRIWEIVSRATQPVLTLDANEAYDDPQRFEQFVERLAEDAVGLFQHVAFIEQPFSRRLALDPAVGPVISRISRRKPLIIDESDDTLDAFPRALQLGYAGTSHKNCKGFFKSLLSQIRIRHLARQDREAIMSGEDLQNLPVVPLQQDFVTVGLLGLEHCERNGHHYNFGLSMLPEADKRQAVADHPDLYERRGEEWFLRIRQGAVRIDSLLLAPGFGVRHEPEWSTMTSLDDWIRQSVGARE